MCVFEGTLTDLLFSKSASVYNETFTPVKDNNRNHSAAACPFWCCVVQCCWVTCVAVLCDPRITLEDDDDDEDLDLDSLPRRPVLVMSDSLKLGLQRSITDLLPHTVAQSV